MRVNLTGIFVAITLMMAAPVGVSAQPEGPDPAEVRAASEAILAETPDSEGIWEIDESGSLRHVQSRMTCFPGNGAPLQFDKLFINPQVAEGDVGCNYNIPSVDGRLSIFATRAGYVGQSADEELGTVIQTMITLYGAKPTDPPFMLEIDDPRATNPKVAAVLLSDEEGLIRKSSVWLNEVNGWMLKIRATYPADTQRATLTEVMAGTIWMLNSAEIKGLAEQ